MGFTTEQQAVIDARKQNVLVSAAAGSGKTTVLVERIIQLITGDDNVDIDRLLVVTFTKAAASQMKEKVLAAISKKLSENPDNKHLQRQETLVHGAQITTIDSFCQYVIRNNFNEIGLDPSYRVLDEGEKKLIMADVLADLLEEKYAEGDKRFINAMEYFSTGSDDKKVEEFILQLYDYAMSMPWPEQWLRQRSNDYELSSEDFEAEEFVKLAKKNAEYTMLECRERMENGLKLSNEPDGPYFYGDLFEKEMDMYDAVISKIEASEKAGIIITFDELRSMLLNITYDRLPSKKDDSVNADKRELASSHRKYAKDKTGTLIKHLFSEDKETILKHMEIAKDPVKELCELTITFMDKFSEKKRERGVIDFHDMEHMALNALVTEDGEPTAAAMSYRDYYKEVMIDEYQDSNNVQELLLSSVSGESIGNFNRFMVGDVKQSIYKFRLARPEIFMKKMAEYSWDEKELSRKIALHKNFRSRSEVLDGVNYIFEQIMGSDLGGVSYDEDAFLRTGASFPEPVEDKNAFATELLLVDSSGEKTKGERVLEAQMIAARIHELREKGRVTDNENGFRPVKYSDIVILLRAQSGWDVVFKKELEDRGIPVYVESRTGYFSAIEVVTVLNLLKVLDNPLQDIPLVSVMKSEIGGFSNEELALIKAADNKREKSITDSGSFYEILEFYAQSEESLVEKVRDFLDFIDDLRDRAVYLPVNELISYIFEKTGYWEYCAALPGGEKRTANLDVLVEKAIDYERTSYRGVFHFIRYIEELHKFEVDYGEANVLDENADVVRIMSIHKSKGLEFPIVFLAGMSKGFNFRDTTNNVCLDMDMGIGTMGIDLEHRIKYRTLRKSVMEDYMKMDILGEEMRILYVAMTRAKEKLIMTGDVSYSQSDKLTDSDIRKKLMELSVLGKRDAIDGIQPYLLPYYKRSGAKSYQDLVLMALARHPAFNMLWDDAFEGTGKEDDTYNVDGIVPFILKIVRRDQLTAAEIEKEVSQEVRLQRLSDAPAEDEKEIISFFDDRFKSVYPYENYSGLFVKTTVSELKKASMVDAEEPVHDIFPEEKYVPTFMGDEQKLRGAARGTVYHKVMELLYEKSEKSLEDKVKDISSWIKSLETEGRIEKGAPGSVKASDIAAFYESSSGQRMKKAYENNRLYRESPFMMGVEATRLNPELPDGELVLVQGIIDVWFEEDDGLVLLDYKTDRVSSGDELLSKYKVQLDYYQEALEKITGKKVKERIIYSFCLSSEIAL